MSELSDRVLRITSTYLGPASLTFLERQVQTHLNGLPFTDLEKHHIAELARWVSLSAARIIDKNRATMLAQIIAKLAH